MSAASRSRSACSKGATVSESVLEALISAFALSVTVSVISTCAGASPGSGRYTLPAHPFGTTASVEAVYFTS